MNETNPTPKAAAERGFTGSGEFYHDDGEPNLGLMAYCGQADLLTEAFAAGCEMHDWLLHDACCGRPGFRGFFRDDHYPHWPDGFRETVRVLIEQGADTKAKHASGNAKYEGCKPWVSNGEAPLHFAAGAWDREIIQQLLDAGAERSATNDLGRTPFDWAIRYSAPQAIVDLLDFDGNPRRNDDLVEAAHAGDLDRVRERIEAGADPNSCDANGMGTLLTFHPEVLRYLLEQGADPNAQRNENISPVLTGLIYGGHLECVRLLIEGGADVNRQNEHNHETALHYAASGSNSDMVKLLLEHGADVGALTKPRMRTYFLWRDARVRGETPLHRAAAWGSAEVIRLLLDAGADPAKIDINKDTPLSYASWHMRDKDIIDMLSYEGSGVGPSAPFQRGVAGRPFQRAFLSRREGRAPWKGRAATPVTKQALLALLETRSPRGETRHSEKLDRAIDRTDRPSATRCIRPGMLGIACLKDGLSCSKRWPVPV